MRTEIIRCDKCNKEISNNYTHEPFEIKVWKCAPQFRRIHRPSHGGIRDPTPTKDYCPECFEKMEKSFN